MPRPPRRILALLLAGAAVASLAACAPAAPAATDAPSQSPDASEAPIFASDEEALAAAVAAYGEYLRVSQQIAHEGTGVERIRHVSTGTYGDVRVGELTAFVDSGLRLEGDYSFDTASLVERSSSGEGELVVIYACQDVTATRLLNRDGVDVTPADRDTRVPLVVEVLLSGNGAVVGGSDMWSGENFC